MPYATQYRKLTQCNKMLLQALSCTTAGLHVRNDWALLLYADCEQGAFDSYQTLRNRHKSPGGKSPPPPDARTATLVRSAMPRNPRGVTKPQNCALRRARLAASSRSRSRPNPVVFLTIVAD